MLLRKWFSFSRSRFASATEFCLAKGVLERGEGWFFPFFLDEFDANLGDEVAEFGRLLLKNFFEGGKGRGIVMGSKDLGLSFV